MKTVQIIGNPIPVLLLVFSYYLFGDIDPDLPSYAGASLVMLWLSLALFTIAFVFLFVLPSSYILLKSENRQYFSFKSKGWLSVLGVNWAFIAFYCLCFLIFVFTI